MNTISQYSQWIHVSDQIGRVSGILTTPDSVKAAMTFAHGAGAGMTHSFMEAMACRLAEKGVATLRFQFPYMERGKKIPDRKQVLMSTVSAAVDLLRESTPGLPVFAAGKSMGGRMSSHAAEAGLDEVRGLVFFGFPLHAPGKPSLDRADHLSRVSCPMLFLQGTRDNLASTELITSVCEGLGDRAELYFEEGADHSFRVLKRSGRTDAEVLDSLAERSTRWVDKICV